MKKIIGLFLSFANILCLSSCDFIFGARSNGPIVKVGFEDLVEPNAEAKDESEYVRLYKMTNEEYLNYILDVYNYLNIKTEYVGTEGRVINTFFGGAPTYEFVKSSSLVDHYDEETNSYTFVAALDLNTSTNNLENDICINLKYDENNDYSVKRTVTYNNVLCSYHILTFMESLQYISTKKELANVLSNYISYDSDFDKNLYKDNFKYECVYSSNYVNVSFEDPNFPINYTYNGLPYSFTCIKGKDYSYMGHENVCHGYYSGRKEDYYFIQRESGFSYTDYKNLVTYNSTIHYEQQFENYEDDMEEIITYENNNKIIYSSLEDLQGDYRSTYGIEDYASSSISGFNDSYINLLFYDCTEEKLSSFHMIGNTLCFTIEETVESDSEKHFISIDGELNIDTCGFSYMLEDEYLCNGKTISNSCCHVSLVYIDDDYKIDFNDELDYTIENFKK